MTVYGNKKTKVVHSKKRNDQCRQKEIEQKNLVTFEQLKEAEAAGYRLCKSCFPDDQFKGG